MHRTLQPGHPRVRTTATCCERTSASIQPSPWHLIAVQPSALSAPRRPLSESRCLLQYIKPMVLDLQPTRVLTVHRWRSTTDCPGRPHQLSALCSTEIFMSVSSSITPQPAISSADQPPNQCLRNGLPCYRPSTSVDPPLSPSVPVA